jgi:hypothetical protein
MNALEELLTAGERLEHCIQPDCPSPPWLCELHPDRIDFACSHGHFWQVPRTNAAPAQSSQEQ